VDADAGETIMGDFAGIAHLTVGADLIAAARLRDTPAGSTVAVVFADGSTFTRRADGVVEAPHAETVRALIIEPAG
jgi:hypothetical protein